MRYANALVAQYDRIGHPLRAKLKRGLSRRSITKAVNKLLAGLHPEIRKSFPDDIPESLALLYEWHNGSDGEEVIPYYDFLRFNIALTGWFDLWEPVFDSVEYQNGNAVFHDTSIFPFLCNGNVDFVVMDVGRHSPTRGSIGKFSANGCSSVRNEYSTLSQFFRAQYECVKSGAYTVDDDGLDDDWKRSRKIKVEFRSKKLQTVNGASV